MFATDEELFANALETLPKEVREHRQFMRISAAASTLLATQSYGLRELNEDQVLRALGLYGFPFETHDEVRLVRQIALTFLDLQEEQRAERARSPLQTFEALFYRDRRGRLMARFSIGNVTFDPVVMEEEWEVKFVRAYHDSLQQALAHGLGKRM